MSGDENLYSFRDVEAEVERVATDYSSRFRGSATPLVMDNGSQQCRVGWASEDDPRLTFHSLVARPRAKKDEHEGVVVGNGIQSGFLAKYTIKSPQESGIVTSWDAQEHLMDHAFACMGIDTEGSVEHPVVITEAFCNLNASRARMHELLFEAYGVPRVGMGVDSLFSHFHNHRDVAQGGYGIVISSGHHASYILPIVNGRADSAKGMRVNVGGMHAIDLVMQSANLRHPNLRGLVSITRAGEIIKDHTYVPPRYGDELRCWEDVEYRRSHEHRFQLPFPADAVPSPEEIREKEERRQEQSRRMKEMVRARTQERIEHLKVVVEAMQKLQDDLLSCSDATARELLEHNGFESVEALGAQVEADNDKLEVMLDKQAGIVRKPKPKPPPTYPLVDIPDDELDAEGLAAKRKQKFLKRMYDGRERARLARVASEKHDRDHETASERLRREDPDAWVASLKAEKQRIKVQLETLAREKSQLTDRRSNAAKARMRLLVQQAQEVNTGRSNARKAKKAKLAEDRFGENEEDWSVYREIGRDDSTGTEEEDSRLARMAEIDAILEQHMPSVPEEINYEQLLQEVKLQHQIHFAADRIRVPEIVFQPNIVGVDEAGITEALQVILSRYSPEVQELLVQNVFVTGGNSLYPGFIERIVADLRAMRPYQSKFNVRQAADPRLDAWRGGSAWAREDGFEAASLSREQYEECGPDYLAEHCNSNVFVQPDAEES